MCECKKNDKYEVWQLVQCDNDDYIHDDDSDDSGVMKFQTDQLSQEC